MHLFKFQIFYTPSLITCYYVCSMHIILCNLNQRRLEDVFCVFYYVFNMYFVNLGWYMIIINIESI